MSRLTAFALVSSLLLLPAAQANIAVQGKHLAVEPVSTTNQTFEAQRAALISELERGERYREIAPMDRRAVMESLQRMASWLESAGSIHQMTEAEKVRLFNEQEKINVLLTAAAADSRIVCTRESRVGTRMQSSNCYTVAERQRRREKDTDDAERWNVGAAFNCDDRDRIC